MFTKIFEDLIQQGQKHSNTLDLDKYVVWLKYCHEEHNILVSVARHL